MTWIHVESVTPIVGLQRGTVQETCADPDQRSREFCVQAGVRFHMEKHAAEQLAIHNCIPPFAIVTGAGVRIKFKTKKALVDAVLAM